MFVNVSKTIQLAHLKNLPLISKMFSHGSGFEFRFNKRLVPICGSCASSNKKMGATVHVTKT
jgi:hypothetical protein